MHCHIGRRERSLLIGIPSANAYLLEWYIGSGLGSQFLEQKSNFAKTLQYWGRLEEPAQSMERVLSQFDLEADGFWGVKLLWAI
jgi:hypothetical protein